MKHEPMKPSQVLGNRVLELRNRRGWTQDELAERMNDLGWVWQRTTIAKIELGQRQVTVDEFVSLAYALGAAPIALLTRPDGEAQGIAPSIETSSTKLWQWMSGQYPMGGRRIDRKKKVPIEFPTGTTHRRFYLDACPDFVMAAEERLPGIRQLISTALQCQSLAGGPAEDIDRILDVVAERLKALETEARLLGARVDMLRGGDAWVKALQERT